MVPRTSLIDEVLCSDLVDDPAGAAAAHPSQLEHAARRRRRWSEDAALAAVALGAVGGFLVLARIISSPSIKALDRGVVRRLGRARHRLSNALVRGLTFFGSVPGAGGISVTAVVLARHRPLVASQIAVGALGGLTAELGIKRFFRRQRPTLLGHLEEVTSTSFPSGHATAAASIYLTLAFVASRSPRLRAHRAALLTAAAVAATSVGVSRVYLGVHWPTDVLSGLALGTAWACTAEAIYDAAGAERSERVCGADAGAV
ncbi:MAG: phosphoesterase [Myxococcaceae bacterium]|jgi:undecaprenyl-diphosphatase|nr:phosphoesterase [Myxococcaceae bacterium]MEA2746940.1 undecaprenyl-diphosphatase [Myxococcales bacterium]